MDGRRAAVVLPGAPGVVHPAQVKDEVGHDGEDSAHNDDDDHLFGTEGVVRRGDVGDRRSSSLGRGCGSNDGHFGRYLGCLFKVGLSLWDLGGGGLEEG